MPEARKVDPTPTDPPAGGELVDVDRFCAEVVAGRHTGHLTQILEAVVHAASTGPSSMRWRLKLDALGDGYAGVEVTEDTITLPAVVTAERYAGHSWKTLAPTESAGDCHAIIIGWLVEDRGLKPADALAAAKQVSLRDVLEMIDTYEVVHGPKEGGTPSGPSPG